MSSNAPVVVATFCEDRGVGDHVRAASDGLRQLVDKCPVHGVTFRFLGGSFGGHDVVVL